MKAATEDNSNLAETANPILSIKSGLLKSALSPAVLLWFLDRLRNSRGKEYRVTKPGSKSSRGNTTSAIIG